MIVWDRGHDNELKKLLLLLITGLVIPGSGMGAFAQTNPGSSSDFTPVVALRLSAQIRSGSTEEKRHALLEIRNFETADASRIAVPALQDRNEMVRATAAASVVFLPKVEASSALIPLLTDKSEFVRREVSYALGDVRDPAAVAPLVRLLQNDKILAVRTAAAIALGKIGDSSAIESLMTVLKKRPVEDDEFLRRSNARSIGQIAQVIATGNPNVLTPQNFLPEKFKDLGPTGVTSITSTFSTAVDVLLRVLQNQEEADDTRREAAFSLGAIGDRKAVPALESYLAAPDPYLVEIVKEALEKIRRRNNVDAAVRI